MRLALLAASFVSSSQGGSLRQNGAAEGFVKALQFKYTLRVCNAYPNDAELDVFRVKEKMTEHPLTYKSCKDLTAPLKTGDKLEFRVGEATAGTFTVSDLPNNDAILLLIIHRHDQVSTAVSFESHVFANLLNAQVAVIDTYKGPLKATLRIKDLEDATKLSRSEELRYSSIVAVNPGIYEVELGGDDGEVKAKTELVALNHQAYVVLRTGVESKTGATSYPQELVVYPKSDPGTFRSGAASLGLVSGLFAMFAAVFA